MVDLSKEGDFGACKCLATERLPKLREEMQLKDDESELLLKRLSLS